MIDVLIDVYEMHHFQKFRPREASEMFHCANLAQNPAFCGLWVLVCQLQQTHTGLVALLLYLVAAENGLDSDLRVAADFTGPVNEPFTIPLDILLVLWRHMLLDRTVLVKPSVQPGMGTDSVSTVENLYRGFGESDTYLLLDVCHSREENTRWHERK